MKGLFVLFELFLILGGILGMSALIVQKKPDAQAILDKLVPFQALIGLGMLALALVVFLYVGPLNVFRAIKPDPVPGMALLAGILAGVALGFLFGLPQLMKLGAGAAAEQKAMEFAQKVAMYQILIGIVAAGAGAVHLLYNLGIMKYAEVVGLSGS